MAYTRTSTLEDAIELAPRLRVEDVAEIAAFSGNSPLAALTGGVGGTECLTIVGDEGQVIGMFGINHLPEFGEGQAAIWLLASPELFSIKSQFLRETGTYLSRFHSQYPLLWNYVDCRNESHVKWLHRCGFVFINKHERFGHEQRPFYEFVRIDPHGQDYPSQ